MGLYTYKTAAMQTMQAVIRGGYYWVNSGRIPSENLSEFVKKIESKLNLRRSRQAVSAARKRGSPVARLIVFPSNEETNPNDFDWWILATDPAIEGEESKRQYRDARSKEGRIVFGDQYELVRINITPPKPLSETTEQRNSRIERGGIRWTWRMTKHNVDYLSDAINRASSHKRIDRMNSLIQGISRAPSFSGIRVDRAKLYREAHNRWIKAHRANQAPELLIPKNYFKRSVKVQTVVRLGQFVDQMQKNDRSAAEQMRIYHSNRSRPSRAQ